MIVTGYLLCRRGIRQVDSSRIICSCSNIIAVVIVSARGHWSCSGTTSRIGPFSNYIVIVYCCYFFEDRCTVASADTSGTSAAAFELGFTLGGCCNCCCRRLCWLFGGCCHLLVFHGAVAGPWQRGHGGWITACGSIVDTT